MEQLAVPQGEFTLARPSSGGRDNLRAWDAADDYLLHHLAEMADGALGASASEDSQPRLLILNDGYGALTTALAHLAPTIGTDSLCSQQATTANLLRNGFDPSGVTLVDSLSPDESRLDLVVIKVPKSQSLLEDQLHRLKPRLDDRSTVIAGAMSKHVHTSTLALVEQILGPTTTTLARRKARLIECTPNPGLASTANPWPKNYEHTHRGTVLQLTNHANVFSPTRLDIGTRCFLEHLPRHDHATSIVDLGCGNGIVGIALGLANPSATITFIDESAMAVESTRHNVGANLGDPLGGTSAHRIVWSDGIRNPLGASAIADESVDLIACNPPFHVDRALADETAWTMMSESLRALSTGGNLWVVGNRHLAYHAKMKRLFGNCTVVGSNPKFVVYRSTKQAGRTVGRDSEAASIIAAGQDTP